MSEPLRRALRAEGGLLGDLVASDGAGAPEPDGPARLASSGPRVRANAEEYALLLDMILEGSLLHYGGARVVRTEDPDLALLVGDQLYALGLGRLAALGDLEAIAVLADVISSLAQAHAESDPGRAEVIWRDGARMIGWGS